jgi:quercetin dioxygenase-like cupin family protein
MKKKPNPGYLVIKLSNAESDPKLSAKPNNGRKVLVNELYPDKEFPSKDPQWKAGNPPAKTPVVATGKGGLEVTSFSQSAKQDRHKHRCGTECYTVLKGRMKIRIDSAPPITLLAGDECIIFPGTAHEILLGRNFLTRVHSINCYGKKDKYVEKNGRWILEERL